MNELEMRTFIRQILEVLRKGATLTGITFDDQACDMVLKAVDSDLLWSWVWSLVQRFVDNGEPLVVSENAELSEACEVAAINPLMVIAIIKAMVELWKTFR